MQAAYQLLQRPFRLSTLLARTLRPHAASQDLHVDYASDDEGWTMLGFILMLDPFTEQNGATRFLPGSHLDPDFRSRLPEDLKDDIPGQVLACADAGALLVFNGSVWHGHTANRTDSPRRSIQGAFIRREAPSGFDLPGRLLPATVARISPLARWVIAAAGGGEERLESAHEFSI